MAAASSRAQLREGTLLEVTGRAAGVQNVKEQDYAFIRDVDDIPGVFKLL